MEKTQIFFIHGGDTFKNRKDYLYWLKTRKISLENRKKWGGEYLDKELGKKFQIIRPQMPLRENANYEDWKIYFERYISYLKNNIIFIGSSLGGMFLAKYLSEHRFLKKILSTYLVCPPFDNTIAGEQLVNRFKLGSDLSLLEKNSKNLYLMFSADDNVVPVSHAEKYRQKLKNAKIFIYKNKNGHFRIPKFPEIVKMIKGDIKTIK